MVEHIFRGGYGFRLALVAFVKGDIDVSVLGGTRFYKL